MDLREMLSIGGIALLVFIAVTILRRQAPVLDLLDSPDGKLKRHQGAVPMVGGIGITIGLLPVFVVMILQDPSLAWAVAGALLLVIVGLIDDRRSLGVGVRFFSQLLAALMLVVGAGVQIQTLGNLLGFGAEVLGNWGVLLSIVGVVGVINAVNMIDGIDGLAASLALVTIAGLWLGTGTLDAGTELLLAALAVGLIVVLLHNLGFLGKQRRIFLGDAGSKLIGYLLAWQLIANSQVAEGIDPVTALWLLAVPLINNFLVMGRRLLHGHSPFNGFRDHLHDLLGELTTSSKHPLLLLFMAAVLLAGTGLGLQLLQVPDFFSFYSALAVFALSILLYRRLIALGLPKAGQQRQESALTEVEAEN